jgi:hypothetical protein
MSPLNKIYTHTDYPLVLIYKDAQGAVINLAGASAEFMISRTVYSTPVITVAATINGPEGKITFGITPTDTALVLDDKDSEKFICGAVLTLDGARIPLFQTTVDIVRSLVTP